MAGKSQQEIYRGSSEGTGEKLITDNCAGEGSSRVISVELRSIRRNGTYLSPASICSSISRHAVNPSLGARRRRSATAPALLYLRDAGPPHPWRSPVGDGLEILLQTLANFTALNKNRLSKCYSSLRVFL